MRITHRRKKEEPKKLYRYNEGITAPQILVLDKDGANLGVMSTMQAVSRARENGMDLVEINPKVNPPVAKIIDFGQFRYQQEKEARIAKAHQHVVELKGVRLSLRIGRHDLEIRKNQTLKFLNEGNKVKIELILRGRELQQTALALEVVRNFAKEVSSVESVRFEQPAERQGNKITAIIAKS
ncbi:MAG TPA: translation initiation factor IF-3 [Patescibacteria group bacterium]|nr:translation initiation factor IF-3 [Patescibacteria group bacterium]